MMRRRGLFWGVQRCARKKDDCVVEFARRGEIKMQRETNFFLNLFLRAKKFSRTALWINIFLRNMNVFPTKSFDRFAPSPRSCTRSLRIHGFQSPNSHRPISSAKQHDVSLHLYYYR